MRASLVLVMAAWLAVAGAGCGPASPSATRAASISADQASQAAVKAFTAQYTSGQKVTDIRVLATVMGPSAQGGPGGIAGQGPDVWRVNVVATITDAGGVPYGAAAWIDVDPVTGVAHIVARG